MLWGSLDRCLMDDETTTQSKKVGSKWKIMEGAADKILPQTPAPESAPAGSPDGLTATVVEAEAEVMKAENGAPAMTAEAAKAAEAMTMAEAEATTALSTVPIEVAANEDVPAAEEAEAKAAAEEAAAKAEEEAAARAVEDEEAAKAAAKAAEEATAKAAEEAAANAAKEAAAAKAAAEAAAAAREAEEAAAKAESQLALTNEVPQDGAETSVGVGPKGKTRRPATTRVRNGKAAAKKGASTVRSSKALPQWDASPHRPVPPALKDQPCEREPWYADAQKWFAEAMDGNGSVGRMKKSKEVLEKELLEKESGSPSTAERSDLGANGHGSLKASLSLKPRVQTLPGPPRRARPSQWEASGRANGSQTFQYARPAASGILTHTDDDAPCNPTDPIAWCSLWPQTCG